MSFTISQSEKTPFQPIKTRSSKSRNIDICPKGLTHGFGPKMAIFQTFFFQAIQARNMSFMIFQNGKKPFQPIKSRSSKSRKIDILAKGLTHGFGPKMAIFPTFFFNQYRPGKCLLRYGFGPKMAIFATVFFVEYTPRKCVLRHCRTKKTPFQAIKTRSPKHRKIDLFPKGLTYGFGPKMAIFATVFFTQQTPGKCLFSYSRTKKRLSRL